MSINAHAGHGFYHALLLILLCFNMAQKLSFARAVDAWLNGFFLGSGCV
jgi:hypothetical protein